MHLRIPGTTSPATNWHDRRIEAEELRHVGHARWNLREEERDRPAGHQQREGQRDRGEHDALGQELTKNLRARGPERREILRTTSRRISGLLVDFPEHGLEITLDGCEFIKWPTSLCYTLSERTGSCIHLAGYADDPAA